MKEEKELEKLQRKATKVARSLENVAFGKKIKKLRRLNLKKEDWKKEHGRDHQVCERLLDRRKESSVLLVNSTKSYKIKSRLEEFGLDAEGSFLMVWLEDTACRFSITGGQVRRVRTGETDVYRKWHRCSRSCCGPGNGPWDISVTSSCPQLLRIDRDLKSRWHKGPHIYSF